MQHLKQSITLSSVFTITMYLNRFQFLAIVFAVICNLSKVSIDVKKIYGCLTFVCLNDRAKT